MRCLHRQLLMSAAMIVVAGTAGAAQQPTDTASRPRPVADTARAPQPIAGVHIEAKPDAKPSTPAEDRMRFGGHLYSKVDIESVGAHGWMDAVRMTPGVSVISFPLRRGSTILARQLSMSGGGGRCTPAVFLNGLRQTIAEHDWDDFVPVEAVEKLEVYSSTNAPLQFRSMNGACGSVVIWTREER